MKKSGYWVLMMSCLAIAACSPSTEFPDTASRTELEEIFRSEAAALEGSPLAGGLRSYGMFFERESGAYSDTKGRVLVVPQKDGAYLVSYYMPLDDDRYVRIGEPHRMEGTRTPRVGNPRGTATCLRAPLTSGSGEWYGCVEKGRLLTGIE